MCCVKDNNQWFSKNLRNTCWPYFKIRVLSFSELMLKSWTDLIYIQTNIENNQSKRDTLVNPRLPACLPSSLPTCLPACLPTWLPTYLPSYLFTYLPTYLPTCLPAYLTVQQRQILRTETFDRNKNWLVIGWKITIQYIGFKVLPQTLIV